MSEKRVKAWAVVTKRGAFKKSAGLLYTYATKIGAEAHCYPPDGERVVPVTIIVEES